MSILTLLLLALAALAGRAASQSAATPRILLYTKTAGFRHESLPIAIRTITSLGNGSLTLPRSAIDPSIADVRWNTVNTEDETRFHNYTFLSQFKAIGFVSTTDQDPPLNGTVLDDQGLRNLARYVEQGGGFFGVHSAAATLFGAPFYGRLVGAYFDYHPQIQNITVRAVEGGHPSTFRFPAEGLRIFEEVYNFRSDPRTLPSPANVLVTNASTYEDPGVNPQGFRNGTNGPAPLPLAWWRQGGLLDSTSTTDPSVRGAGGANIQASGGPGRSWYTSLGHDSSTWQLDLFRGHIAGGIAWVLASDAFTPAQSSNTSSSADTSSTASASPTNSNSNSNDAGRQWITSVPASMLLAVLAALLLIMSNVA
ncbi:hypothetical protein PSEUBRA_002646 [Kalmanozyma brasiliensis GHG001]|uniref:uncharacterized protein n=1 Tax=Kalmanozyma brasiliensis (strain GHG001) TaxID=1365824 RepID=UPI00286808DE|nr:uncharacterized protein PSEUBRA_002646 [Kalmanozyma brasiliensis GHG001]KAF6767110.1 hypothetical protein PSEUBRA_002646 [Kalmanozyma brasiliensis GHG001]